MRLEIAKPAASSLALLILTPVDYLCMDWAMLSSLTRLASCAFKAFMFVLITVIVDSLD